MTLTRWLSVSTLRVRRFADDLRTNRENAAKVVRMG